ncbi:MAG TPA: serine/threonine-protein kinase [Planctomycetota bacterium]|jgi:tetratricopeptide (TPR) repeat protein|nr:serine/threonine-protein kinase [Planctomycetota bacterium]
MIGRRLSHYTVLERLGAGAMGEVYRARDETLGREVALKVLPSSFASDPERKERFLREAHLTSLLSHPNIATVYAAGEAEGVLFFAMELVRGETLESRIRPGGLSREEILDLALPIAEGLAEAHRTGVVHRDLKPANVMIDERGRVKILDFGLSRPSGGLDEFAPGLTASGSVMGTPYYMSPEQMRGKKVDARSDLFSLGVTLYQLGTGERPFGGETLGEVMESVFQGDPLPLDRANPRIGGDLSSTVTKLLSKDPDRRFQSAEELLAELRGLKASSTVVAPPRRPPPPAPQRRRALAAAAAALLVALALGVFLLRGSRPPVARPGGKPLLAILPLKVIEPDADAQRIARTILYSLPQAIACPAVEVLSPTYLADRARKKGIETLDSENGTDVAREAGADLLVSGTIGPGSRGFELHCELRTMDGVIKANPRIPPLRPQDVRDVVETLAAAILAPLGVTPEKAGALATLSGSAIALQEFADGLAAMQRLDPREAESRFAEALRADETFALAHFHRARALGWMGGPENLRKCGEAYRKALANARRLSEVDQEKARLLLDVLLSPRAPTDFGKAERARRLGRENPRDKDALEVWMEVAYHDPLEGSAAEAVEACETLLALDPDYGPAHQHLLQAATWAGRHDLARRAAESLAKRASESSWEPQALLYLGRDAEARDLAQRRGREGRSHWDRAVAIDVAFGVGDAALAEELTGLGWEEDPDAFLFERTKALFALGRFDDVRAILEKEVRRIPERRNHIRGVRLALLHLDAGLEPPAAGPEDPWSALVRAGWLARLRRAEEAEASLAAIPPPVRAIPSVRRLADWAQGEILLAKGSAPGALGRFDAAAPEPGKAESVDVAHLAGFFVERAARAHLEEGDFDAAQALLQRLTRTSGWFLLGAGALAPAQVRSDYDEARCLEERGSKERAREAYARFLRRWPAPDPAAPEVEEALRRYARLAGSPWRPG